MQQLIKRQSIFQNPDISLITDDLKLSITKNQLTQLLKEVEQAKSTQKNLQYDIQSLQQQKQELTSQVGIFRKKIEQAKQWLLKKETLNQEINTLQNLKSTTLEHYHENIIKCKAKISDLKKQWQSLKGYYEKQYDQLQDKVKSSQSILHATLNANEADIAALQHQQEQKKIEMERQFITALNQLKTQYQQQIQMIREEYVMTLRQKRKLVDHEQRIVDQQIQRMNIRIKEEHERMLAQYHEMVSRIQKMLSLELSPQFAKLDELLSKSVDLGSQKNIIPLKQRAS